MKSIINNNLSVKDQYTITSEEGFSVEYQVDRTQTDPLYAIRQYTINPSTREELMNVVMAAYKKGEGVVKTLLDDPSSPLRHNSITIPMIRAYLYLQGYQLALLRNTNDIDYGPDILKQKNLPLVLIYQENLNIYAVKPYVKNVREQLNREDLYDTSYYQIAVDYPFSTTTYVRIPITEPRQEQTFEPSNLAHNFGLSKGRYFQFFQNLTDVMKATNPPMTQIHADPRILRNLIKLQTDPAIKKQCEGLSDKQSALFLMNKAKEPMENDDIYIPDYLIYKITGKPTDVLTWVSTNNFEQIKQHLVGWIYPHENDSFVDECIAKPAENTSTVPVSNNNNQASSSSVAVADTNNVNNNQASNVSSSHFSLFSRLHALKDTYFPKTTSFSNQ